MGKDQKEMEKNEQLLQQDVGTVNYFYPLLCQNVVLTIN